MSRSRKKPYVSDYSRKGTRKSKRSASKVVRRYMNELPNGRGYKKIYCSWDIFDYCSFWDDPKAYRK